MPVKNTSIDLYFQPKVCNILTPPIPSSVKSARLCGDGFTENEIEAVTCPEINTTWRPEKHFELMNIASLDAGPRCVIIQGRVVNFFNQATPKKRPAAAKGCIKLIVKDNTGAIAVRLWYANMEYHLRLGQLVSIWTPHISNGDHSAYTISQIPLFTNIFPEREKSCHFMIQDDRDSSVLRTPLDTSTEEAIPELMTLKNYADGGFDVPGARILVCVKGVGLKKKVTGVKGVTEDLVKVIVFDDTSEATLSIWGPVTSSPLTWRASHTILLLTRPGLRANRTIWLSLTADTMVDIDPEIPDAHWMRAYAQRMTKKTHINPPFPEEINFESFYHSPQKLLFNLGDIDLFARESPPDPIIGLISVIVMELNILKLHRRNMLLCNECCGIPVYANAISSKCKHCGKSVNLKINPRLLGTLIDESGCTVPGKMILSSRAWETLLGRTAEGLLTASQDVRKYLEDRLLFLRLTLLFGWVPEEDGVGRLCVWDIQM